VEELEKLSFKPAAQVVDLGHGELQFGCEVLSLGDTLSQEVKDSLEPPLGTEEVFKACFERLELVLRFLLEESLRRAGIGC